MVRNRVGQTLQQKFKEKSSLYLFTIVLFMMGVGFGAVVVNSLGLTQKQELFMYINQFFQEVKGNNIAEPALAFQNSLGNYLKYIGFMWILGLSIIGIPVILIMVFLKGVMVGFTIGFLVDQMQWKGFSFALVSVMPQNLIVVPAMIIIATTALSFSLNMIQNRFKKHQVGVSVYSHLLSYSFLILVMLGAMVIAAGIEAYVSPNLMKQVIASL